jgi:ParB family chromosome partitioning protein
MPEVKLTDIIVDEKFNSRDTIDPIGIKNLAEDIEENGLINPVTLMDNGDGKYKLIAGFSRFFAFQALSRETIPATIMAEMDEIAQRSVNLRENLCR